MVEPNNLSCAGQAGEQTTVTSNSASKSTVPSIALMFLSLAPSCGMCLLNFSRHSLETAL